MTTADEPPQFTTAQFEEMPAESHAFFLRGLLFGVGGAILGMILYAAVGIITGLAIGFVSIAVGYIVGRAIVMGSGGRRGRRYQIVAVVLTYLSVSAAIIPIALWQFAKGANAETTIAEGAAPTSDASASTDTVKAAPRPESIPVAGDAAATAPGDEFVDASLSSVLGSLLLLAVASPFLDLFESPGQGLIGLLILGIGVRVAWKQTGIAGPTEIAPAEPVSPLGTMGVLPPNDDKPTSLNIRG
jgi:hypothetical protein